MSSAAWHRRLGAEGRRRRRPRSRRAQVVTSLGPRLPADPCLRGAGAFVPASDLSNLEGEVKVGDGLLPQMPPWNNMEIKSRCGAACTLILGNVPQRGCSRVNAETSRPSLRFPGLLPGLG